MDFNFFGFLHWRIISLIFDLAYHSLVLIWKLIVLNYFCPTFYLLETNMPRNYFKRRRHKKRMKI